jgi:hypothetical protein
MNDASGTPDWIREGLRQTRDELVLFLKTAWAITRRPREFGGSWSRGEAKALNPLAFLATSLAFSGVSQHLLFRWLRIDEGSSSLLGEIVSNAFPYLWYLIFGLIVHTALRVVRLSPLPRTTLGIVLFAAGGPAMIVRLFSITFNARGAWSLDQTIWITSILSVVFWRSVARAMVGALDADRRQVGKAMGLSGVAVGMFWFFAGWLFPQFVSSYLHASMP